MDGNTLPWSSCLKCPKGYASNKAGVASCDPCNPPDKFQDEVGQRHCNTPTSCPAGWYVAVEPTAIADTDCDPCPPGSYTDVTDQPSCFPCSLGTTFQPASGATKCLPVTPCTPGEFLVLPATATTDQLCTVCPGGTISNATDATSCTPCPSGHYAPRNSSACAPFSPACGANQIEVTPPTFSSDRVCEEVVSCAPGEYVVRELDREQRVNRGCATCGHGTYSSVDNAANCTR